MSITDSTQLESHVSAGMTIDVEAPRVKAHADDTGIVSLFIGPLCVTFKATDAANVAASLATAAATAMVNNVLKFNDEDRTLTVVPE